MSVIRLANSGDAKGILEIYAPYIKDTSFTFETEVPSLEAFGQRITSYLQQCPWLVCEIDGRIAGYAYANRHRERVAYQWCCESSIYIHDDFLRAGIGGILYSTLFAILKKQGFCNVYAVINLPNERSVAFHEKMGFEYFATYKSVGYKLGKWKNVGWWQLVINDYAIEPEPPVRLPDLDKGFVEELLREASYHSSLRITNSKQ